MNVEYKTLQWLPGYRFGSDGSVWSCFAGHDGTKALLGHEWRTVRGEIRNGYRSISVKRGGKRARLYVHRLIAEAFHGPSPSGCRVTRHLNGNRQDNRPLNLAWGSHGQNQADMIDHGRSTRGQKNLGNILTETDVREIRSLLAAGQKQGHIAAKFKVARTTVSSIAIGKSWYWLD